MKSGEIKWGWLIVMVLAFVACMVKTLVGRASSAHPTTDVPKPRLSRAAERGTVPRSAARRG